MDGPGATEYVIIAGFMLDCTLSERHVFDSDVTDYPVESGINITDNIRPLPIVVEIEGLVTNSPIGPIAAERGALGALGVKPTDDCYDTLTGIWKKREPVIIRTSLRRYDNMAMKSLTFPRGDHEDALKFNATFQQVISVDNKRTTRVSIPIATGTGNGRTKDVTKPPEPSDMRQVALCTKTKMWFDPDFNTWRAYWSYEPPSRTIQQNLGSTTVTIGPKYNLYRNFVERVSAINNPIDGSTQLTSFRPAVGVGQEEATNDPFDTIRNDGRHPANKQIIVTLNQCILRGTNHEPNGFTIKGSTVRPARLRNRTL